MDIDLGERIFSFVINVVKFCKRQRLTIENRIIVNQLIKAVTSIGANYEEAQGASSKADFRNKIKISLKEARETNYWLRIFQALSNDNDNIEEYLDESGQLIKILGKISSSSRN